jgi:hypothetical protein
MFITRDRDSRWNDIASPQVSVTRANSAQVVRTETTTYTLYPTNQYRKTTAKVKVTVQ